MQSKSERYRADRFIGQTATGCLRSNRGADVLFKSSHDVAADWRGSEWIFSGRRKAHFGKGVIVMNIKAKITAVSAAAAVALLVASSADAGTHMAKHHMMMVAMMGHTTATMDDGTKLDVDIVKVNGHMMVMIPAGELPDYLHQQIFKVGQ
jgi:hypothetical protein